MDAKGVDSGRSARNHLLALGTTVGVGPRRVDEVLASVGLSEVAGRSAGSFSLGMGQRLGIAARAFHRIATTRAVASPPPTRKRR